MLNLHRLTSCTLLCSSSLMPACFLVCMLLLLLLQLRNSTHLYSRGTDIHHRKHVTWSLSSQSIGTSCTDIEKTCHVTATHCCVTSQWTRKTQLPLLLHVGPRLQSCCLAMRWSNPSKFVFISCGGNATCFDPFLGHLQAYKNTGTHSWIASLNNMNSYCACMNSYTNKYTLIQMWFKYS
jgi:hypothetical protein